MHIAKLQQNSTTWYQVSRFEHLCCCLWVSCELVSIYDDTSNPPIKQSNHFNQYQLEYAMPSCNTVQSHITHTYIHTYIHTLLSTTLNKNREEWSIHPCDMMLCTCTVCCLFPPIFVHIYDDWLIHDRLNNWRNVWRVVGWLIEGWRAQRTIACMEAYGLGRVDMVICCRRRVRLCKRLRRVLPWSVRT